MPIYGRFSHLLASDNILARRTSARFDDVNRFGKETMLSASIVAATSYTFLNGGGYLIREVRGGQEMG